MRKVNRKIRSNKIQSKYRRKLHLRAKLNGTSSTPRVCVTKSNKNIYVQADGELVGTGGFRAEVLANKLPFVICSV